MRHVFRIGFALALGLALMVGCSDENGEGGSPLKLFCDETYCPVCEEEGGPWGCLSQCSSGSTEPDVCDDAKVEFKKCELLNDLCFVEPSEQERDEESPCYWEAVDWLDCVNTRDGF